MARQPSQRDTRCISAAFSFLKTTEYCPDCLFGIDVDGFSNENAASINTVSSGGMLMKKSESMDTALQNCQDQNKRNAEKVRVCMCDHKKSVDGFDANGISVDRETSERSAPADLHKEGAVEGNEGSMEGGQVKAGLESCSRNGDGDKGKDVNHLTLKGEEQKTVSTSGSDNKLTGVERGLATPSLNGQCPGNISTRVHLRKTDGCDHCDSGVYCGCENSDPDLIVADRGGEAVHSHNSDDDCSAMNRLTDSCFTSLHSVQVIDTDGSVEASQDTACKNQYESGIEQRRTQIVEGTEVELRLNPRSSGRRSTETAVISDAFQFLPSSSDSVFIPTVPAESRSPTRGRHSGVQSLMSLSIVAEEVKDGQGRFHTEKSEGYDPDTRDDGTESTVVAEQSIDILDGTIRKVGLNEASGKVVNSSLSEPSLTDVKLRRTRLSHQDSITEEEGSGDSSDEDAGIYSASFRRSNWMRIDDNGELELAFPAVDGKASPAGSRSFRMSPDLTAGSGSESPSPKVLSDEPPVFAEKYPTPHLFVSPKRSDSNSTTLSEKEFKKEYIGKRRFLIQRKNSSLEYHRYSSKVYDDEKTLTLEKAANETDFGIHILDSQPAYITKVDTCSAAERAGVEEGQILVALNGTNVLSLSHNDIVALISGCPGSIQIDVANSDFQPSRNLQASVLEGHMQKLGGSSSIVKRWKKRYFVLRQDSCLYYYKQRDVGSDFRDIMETDPLGAIPLAGYTFSRHLDSGRDFCFKAEKYGARTYYFMTENRDEMTEWVGALSEAAGNAKKRKDSFVSVSSHNVGLPALEVRRPECTGYLLKVGHRHKRWRRRYCVLKDACLYYYKNVNCLSALGVAHLHGYKVDPSVSIGKKHAFGVIPPEESLRKFYFSADNDTDRQRWVDAMIHSLQRWIQIDNDC